jgi:hypothetical protein
MKQFFPLNTRKAPQRHEERREDNPLQSFLRSSCCCGAHSLSDSSCFSSTCCLATVKRVAHTRSHVATSHDAPSPAEWKSWASYQSASKCESLCVGLALLFKDTLTFRSQRKTPFAAEDEQIRLVSCCIKNGATDVSF